MGETAAASKRDRHVLASVSSRKWRRGGFPLTGTGTGAARLLTYVFPLSFIHQLRFLPWWQ